MFELIEVGSLLVPLQKGHLHMVLIKLMLHQKSPDEWSDLWLFCPLANVSAPCLARTPCGGRKVADAEDKEFLHFFLFKKPDFSLQLDSKTPPEFLWNRVAAAVFCPAASTFRASKRLLCAPSAFLFPPFEFVRVAKVHAVRTSLVYFSEKWP